MSLVCFASIKSQDSEDTVNKVTSKGCTDFWTVTTLLSPSFGVRFFGIAHAGVIILGTIFEA